MRQKFPRPVSGLPVIFFQALFRQAENALGSPSVYVVLFEDDPPAAFFKGNLTVLDPPLDIGAGQVQIPGHFFNVQQLVWHKSPASIGLLSHGLADKRYVIPRVNGHAVEKVYDYG
jgi:hypothetical protein